MRVKNLILSLGTVKTWLLLSLEDFLYVLNISVSSFFRWSLLLMSVGYIVKYPSHSFVADLGSSLFFIFRLYIVVSFDFPSLFLHGTGYVVKWGVKLSMVPSTAPGIQ